MRSLLTLGSSAVAVGASLIAKGVLLLTVSAVAYATLPDVEIVDFFQMLFVQGIVMTFVSAAGFYATLGGGSEDRARIFSSAKLAVVAAVVLAILPAFYSFEASTVAYLLIGLGGLATGISAPLSGLTARERGYWRAFGPSVVTALAALAFLFLAPVPPHLRIYGALATSQVGYLVWLVYQNKSLIFSPIVQDTTSALTSTRIRTATFVYGALNTVTLVTILYIREHWATLTDPALAASVFFALRVSDTALQIITMIFVAPVKRVLTDRGAVARFASASLALAIVGLLVIGLSPVIPSSSWLFVVVALAGLEMIRLPAAMAFVVQMVQRNPRHYAVYVLIPCVVGISVLYLGPASWPALIHLTLGAMSLSALIVTLWALRGLGAEPSSHRPDPSY